jgi:Tudor domain
LLFGRSSSCLYWRCCIARELFSLSLINSKHVNEFASTVFEMAALNDKMDSWIQFVDGKWKNENELYLLLSKLLVNQHTSKTYHSEAAGKLLNVLDECHFPEVHVVACMLISYMCNASPSIKGDLASRGAISSLVNCLKITMEQLGKTASSHPMWQLNVQLTEHITSLLQYFSQGPSVCITKLLRRDIFSSLVSVVDFDSRTLYVNGRGATDILQSLTLHRKLVGKRQMMVSGAADYVGCAYFGLDSVSKVSFLSMPFVIDVYDTSTAEDVHIVDRLHQQCGSNNVWLYEASNDPDVDDPQNDEGEWVDVHVTHIIDGAYFWAALGPDDKEKLDGMCHQLDAAIRVAGHPAVIPTLPQPGQLVYVLNNNIGWYRAQVISSHDMEVFKVFAVDYGFIRNEVRSQLRLPDDCDQIKLMPALSHLCKLKGELASLLY